MLIFYAILSTLHFYRSFGERVSLLFSIIVPDTHRGKNRRKHERQRKQLTHIPNMPLAHSEFSR
jgi:hypothetical protein